MCQASYERLRRRELAYGRWQPRVPPAAARAHVEKLLAAGLLPRQIAYLAGVHDNTILNVMQPKWKTISSKVERAILAVPVPESPADVIADNSFVSIVGSRRRMQALVANGHPRAHLARDLGMNPASSAVGALFGRLNTANGSTGEVIPAARHRAVKALFDRKQMTPGPSNRARKDGARLGWPLPFQWDEGTIDDPNAKPKPVRWTPKSAREERREQVRELTAAGLSAEQIAARLGVTTRTVVRDRQLIEAESPEHELGRSA